MSDQPPRRPILKLKNPLPPRVEAALAAAAPPPPLVRWKCKPCGANIPLTGAEPPAEIIRCPACNARLGTAEEFAAGASRVRARRVEGAT